MTFKTLRLVVAVLLGFGLAPAAAYAQQPALPVIGFLNGQSAAGWAPYVAAFHDGLRETGHADGENVAIEYHWADGQNDRMRALATDLVRRPVAVLVVTGGASAAVRAAKRATSTVPIVFATGGDPVEAGLVASFSQPGANVTGVTVFTSQLGARRLQLLRELLPKATAVALLVNPENPTFALEMSDIQQAARDSGLQAHVVTARREAELDLAFVTLVERQAGALITTADPLFNSQRDRLVALAASHAVPAIWEWREFAAAGGLMSYGTNLPEMYRQVGIYTGRILNGDNPADLPILRPTKFELVLNLKTAKVLGLEFPPTLLATADEVIE